MVQVTATGGVAAALPSGPAGRGGIDGAAAYRADWRPSAAAAAPSPKSAPAPEGGSAARVHRNALVAGDVYNDVARPPAGARVAGPADLDRLGLTPELLEQPGVSDFRARVYVTGSAGDEHYVVAFRGTQSGNDWKANFRQGAGLPSAHYNAALEIGRRIARSGAPVEMTGHSLGGGLASAASRASGLNATTFNAATLRKATVPQPNAGGVIDAVSVRGDPLTRINEGLLGTTKGTVPYKLDPPANLGQGVARKLPWHDLKGKAQAAGARQLALHGMDTANQAMAQRLGQIDRLLAGGR